MWRFLSCMYSLIYQFSMWYVLYNQSNCWCLVITCSYFRQSFQKQNCNTNYQDAVWYYSRQSIQRISVLFMYILPVLSYRMMGLESTDIMASKLLASIWHPYVICIYCSMHSLWLHNSCIIKSSLKFIFVYT